MAVFLIIWMLAAFFTGFIAGTMLWGILRCVGGGFLGAADDEAPHDRRKPTWWIDDLTVEERQRQSRALVVEQLRQLTLRPICDDEQRTTAHRRHRAS
jgi:hypothetical protein